MAYHRDQPLPTDDIWGFLQHRAKYLKDRYPEGDHLNIFEMADYRRSGVAPGRILKVLNGDLKCRHNGHGGRCAGRCRLEEMRSSTEIEEVESPLSLSSSPTSEAIQEAHAVSMSRMTRAVMARMLPISSSLLPTAPAALHNNSQQLVRDGATLDFLMTPKKNLETAPHGVRRWTVHDERPVMVERCGDDAPEQGCGGKRPVGKVTRASIWTSCRKVNVLLTRIEGAQGMG